MRKKKKRMLVAISILGFIILFYVGVSIWTGITVDKIVSSSYERFGELSDELGGVISAEDYKLLNIRERSSRMTDESEEINERTFPIVFHTFFTAKASYNIKYNCIIHPDGSEGLGYITRVTIILRLNNFHWEVVAVQMPPN